MLLYVIRHGDPIYNPDTLTDKGRLQAAALAKRLAVNGLDRIYSSPLGRAKETADPTSQLLGIDYEIEEWTSESLVWNDFHIKNANGEDRWIFAQQNTDLRNDHTVGAGSNWADLSVYDSIDVKKGYDRIIKHSDDFLSRQGYQRDGSIYRILRPNEDRVALFCHQGFSLVWLAHLLQIPPHLIWSGFDISHSAVSIFHFENYSNSYTAPKCLSLSDLSHIYADGLPMQYNNEIDI